MEDVKEVLEKVSKNHGKPVASYKLIYDSPQNQLEPIYYWILDFVNNLGFTVEKVTDNFMSSPGSGHFSEMGQRATLMQQQGTKISADLHQLIKSTINLLYDLREFGQRLSHYDDARSKDKKKKEAGILALKQIWLDSVDLPRRGRGSIHQMSADLGYVTLRDAFMIANTVEDVERMAAKEGTINDAVKRIMIPRIDEFLNWQDKSYKELKKRESIERNYLRSQIETIKLYSTWMKPYFKAAEQLRQKGFDKNAALVNAFSTSMFELTLFAKQKTEAPKQIKGYNIRRDYNSVLLINFLYRGHSAHKADQKGNYAFGFGGRVDITFDAYSLNEEELTLMKKKMESEDFEQGLKYSFDIAEDALKELKNDFDYFLKTKEERDKEDSKYNKDASQDLNPFTALFDLFRPSSYSSSTKKGNSVEINDEKDIKPDNWVEKHLRMEAANTAAARLYTTYDVYKKAHKMPSSSVDFDNYKKKNVSPSVKKFTEALELPKKDKQNP